MTDNKPAYTVRATETDGTPRYFAAFEDGGGTRQEIEVDRDVYLALDACRLAEKRQINETERHWERCKLTENQLTARTLRPQKPMEEAVAQAVDMQTALATLTDTQRRRFLLHHEHKLTNEQIARVEGCSERAVKYSVTTAKWHLKKFLETDFPFAPLSEE
jgi:RNA polymerase sigma-70 factor (ECF subfamily)